jgi:hypothetical protein
MGLFDFLTRDKAPVFKIGIEEQHYPVYTNAKGETVEMTPEQYKNVQAESVPEDVSLTYGIATMPMGLGATATKGLATKLMPHFGKKIAQQTAEGIGGGLAGGTVMGGIDAAQNGENVPLGMLTGGTIGALTGGALGLGGGYIGKSFAKRELYNNPLARQRYSDDYLFGLDGYDEALKGSIKAGSPFENEYKEYQKLWQGYRGKGDTERQYLFAGENASNADINALTEAERMYLYENAKNLDIWGNTGWFKGVDGEWRFEIPNGKLIDDINWQNGIDIDNKPFQTAKLSDVYDNPTFYEAYPEAKNLNIYLSDLGDKSGSYHELGQYIDLDKTSNYRTYDPAKLKLLEEIKQTPLYKKAHEFRSDKPFEEIRDDYLEYKNSDLYQKEDELLQNLTVDGWNKEALNTLQHELQHFIQGQENFARGGNPKSAGGFQNYNRLAGETEARTVEARQKLTPEQMREYAPFLKGNYGYDVAPTKQLLDKGYGVYGKGEVYSVKKNGLYDKLVDNTVDLTNNFDKTPTIQEVKTHIKDLIDSGKVFDTLDDDWKIDIRGNTAKIDHIAKSSKYGKMNKSKRNRHNKYVMSLENLINNSKYTHLKDNTKPLKKPNIDKYHYFETNVKIGDKKYKVILNAEQYKGESSIKPQTVHLYDVLEVK